jgi:hypothetical protein
MIRFERGLSFTLQTKVRSYEHHRSSFRQVLLVELAMGLLSDSLFSFPMFSVFMYTALLPLTHTHFIMYLYHVYPGDTSVVIPSVITFVLSLETTFQIVLILSRAIVSLVI